MKTVALNMHQYRSTAAPAPIRAKVWNVRSRLDPNISIRPICSYDSAVCYIFDPGHVGEGSELPTMGPGPFLQTFRKPGKADFSASIRSWWRPLLPAIKRDSLTLD